MSGTGSGWPRWSVSLLVVLLVHAGVVVAALWWSQQPEPLRVDAPMEAVMVELAPRPEAPQQPATALPTGPERKEQHKVAPTPQVRPLPPPPPSAVAREPAPPEPPQQPASDVANVAQSTAPPDVAATPGERYAAPQTVSGTQGVVVATWQGLLLGHLEQYRRYPRQAERLRQQGVAYVRFSVDRQGNVSSIHIGRSSGHALLDAATLETVQRGSPVPPPPPEIEGNPVEVMVPVEFFLRRR